MNEFPDIAKFPCITYYFSGKFVGVSPSIYLLAFSPLFNAEDLIISKKNIHNILKKYMIYKEECYIRNKFSRKFLVKHYLSFKRSFLLHFIHPLIVYLSKSSAIFFAGIWLVLIVRLLFKHRESLWSKLFNSGETKCGSLQESFSMEFHEC